MRQYMIAVIARETSIKNGKGIVIQRAPNVSIFSGKHYNQRKQKMTAKQGGILLFSWLLNNITQSM